MRVLHLRASGGVYGAERVISALAGEQARLGIEPHVACLEPRAGGPFQASLARAGIAAHALPDRGGVDPAAAAGLVGLVRRVAPDVVHSHGYKTDVLAALLGPALGRPCLVATNHNWTGETRALRVYERLDAIALRRFDLVVAVSRAVAAELAAAGIRRLTVIANGIPIAPPPTDPGRLRRELGLAPAAPLVGYVGRLSPEKGVRDLLDAMAASPVAGVHLALVGEGPLREELARTIRARGLARRVHLVGRREDAADLLAGLDALVLPSHREGTPMVLLEAMAAGVPAVATAVGGVPDVVGNGESGILVPPRDAAALAVAIRRVTEDAALRRRLGDEAARTVRARFDAAGMARRYAEAYRAALARGPRRARAVAGAGVP
jgi:glycosyltransferase involved in cell wall biosynthesis